MKSHELIKDADHPPAREGQAERDVQAFPVPLIEDRQQAYATAVVERVT